MSEDERKLEHLKLVEGVVERMASHSLRMKEWFVTITAAIVGFSVNNANSDLALVAIGPLLIFWVLDACYLMEERRYRDLYKLSDEGLVSPYSLNTKIDKIKRGFAGAFFWSWSTTGFYGVILIIGILVFCFRDHLFKNLKDDSTNIQKVSISSIEVDKMSRKVNYVYEGQSTTLPSNDVQSTRHP